MAQHLLDRTVEEEEAEFNRSTRSASTSSTHELEGPPHPTSTSSYFSYPVKYAVSGVLRRLSTDPIIPRRRASPQASSDALSSIAGSFYSPFASNGGDDTRSPTSYTPPRYTPPFQPPPLTPLTLKGYKPGTPTSAHILSRALAEEIRLLVPTRLELVDTWNLIFGLEQDGSSLKTLYDKCAEYRGRRGGFVLVVRDSSGNVFGAYLNETPRPSNGHYYGTGECFLWRSSILSSIPSLMSLPPLPSEDTTNAQRMTTLGSLSTRWPRRTGTSTPGSVRSGTSTPERLRFKAFPYSGINDYMLFCEPSFLSVGGGDGHYGLWIDSSLEHGISSSCPTFGNEPLSDEGTKFDVIGIEIWYIGS